MEITQRKTRNVKYHTFVIRRHTLIEPKAGRITPANTRPFQTFKTPALRIYFPDSEWGGSGLKGESAQPEASRETAGEITRILEEGLAGTDTTAALLPLVYGELRRMAAYRLAREKPGQTLQPTALVHEAYLRLIKNPEAHWENKRHFFTAAAEAMRRILIENARRKACRKRGGEWHRTEMDVTEVGISAPSDELLEIHEVLDQLAEVDPESAELVKLRFFAGLTQKQSADILGMSKHAADKSWTFARAWLFRAIHENER
jgi:RNA polymerase sigma factor (TIGR02999 family)